MVQMKIFLSPKGQWTVSGEGFVITPREEGVERRDTVVYPVEVRDVSKTEGCTRQPHNKNFPKHQPS